MNERSRTALREWQLGAATFIIGVGVMAVEITASRLIAPYFGASLFVWTSLIVTVLVALSIGYWLGGALAGKGAAIEQVGLFCVGAGGLLLFGTLILPSFSRSISGILVGLDSASMALFVGSLVVTMIAFALPVFLLAMAGPILLKSWSSLGDVGRISGRYFAVSTIGSVIGTVAPTLVLVPQFGARRTVEGVALLFFALGLTLLRRWRLSLAAIIAVPSLTLSAALTPGLPPGAIAERESPYQLIRVVDQGYRRYLVFNEGSGIQSVLMRRGGRTGMYYDYVPVAPLLRPWREDHKALILGLAGGSLARSYGDFLTDAQRPELTGVEIDADVIKIARRYFDLDALPVDVVNADARTFLEAASGPYDVIIADAYSTQLYIPPHMATREFYALARDRLWDDGLLVMNVNAPSRDSRLLTALLNTVAAEFPHVEVMPVQDSWNFIVFASREPIDLASADRELPAGGYDDVRLSLVQAFGVTHDPDREFFTDDRAPVDFLTDTMIMAQAFTKPVR